MPYAHRRLLLQSWASSLAGFTAIDFDCSLHPLLSDPPLERSYVVLEGKDVLSALVDVYALPKGERPILVNSLGTLRAMAMAAGGEKDWSRRFFRYVAYLTVACKARAGSAFFLLNSFREGNVRHLLGASWVRLCEGTFDGTWILSEEGLSRPS